MLGGGALLLPLKHYNYMYTHANMHCSNNIELWNLLTLYQFCLQITNSICKMCF